MSKEYILRHNRRVKRRNRRAVMCFIGELLGAMSFWIVAYFLAEVIL